MHFEGNSETAVHNHEGAFFVAFLFSDGFFASLMVDPCYDLKKALKLPHSIQQDTSDLLVYSLVG